MLDLACLVEQLGPSLPFQSLEELGIDDSMATAAGLQSLIPLKRLRAVHVTELLFPDNDYNDSDDWAQLALDDGHKLDVAASKLDGVRRALAALRETHPGIVIDTDYDGFQSRAFPPVDWLEPPPNSEPVYGRGP